MPAADIAVVIPTRARAGRAWRTAESVLDDAVSEVIIVADDHAADDDAARTSAVAGADDRIRVVATGGTGASRARHIGTEAATSDVVLFLDDDVLAAPGLAAGHLAHHQRDSGLVVQGYMPTIAPTSRRLDDLPARIYATNYDLYVGRVTQDPSTLLRNLWGGNVSLHRGDALRVGLAGPLPLRRHEDLYFGLRCEAAGLRGRFDRDLGAEHDLVRTFDEMLLVAYEYGSAEVALEQAFPGEYSGDAERAKAGRRRWPTRLVVGTATVPGLGRCSAALTRAGAASLRGARTEGVQLRCATLAFDLAHRRGRAAAATASATT